MTSEAPPASAAGSTPTHQVVVNNEEQYSVWPLADPLPNGWRTDGTTGSKDGCLAHIGRVWTDMRPLSIRDEPTGAVPT